MTSVEFFAPLEPGSQKEQYWRFGCTVLALMMLGLDQATKIAVEHTLVLHQSVPVLDGCFQLTYVINRGAAWGILSGKIWLLLAVSFTAAAGALIFLRKLTEQYPERLCAVFLVLSGIAGNAIDRIWRTGVVDFLDFYWKSYHWPAFNLADICICTGVGLFLLSSLLRPDSPKAPEAAK